MYHILPAKTTNSVLILSGLLSLIAKSYLWQHSPADGLLRNLWNLHLMRFKADPYKISKNYQYSTLFLIRKAIFAALKIYLMANHAATRKDVRQSRKRNERNRYHGKTTRN